MGRRSVEQKGLKVELQRINRKLNDFIGIKKDIQTFNRNVEILKDVKEEMRDFNNNLQYNTNQTAKLKTEITTQMKIEEDNQRFMQDIITRLLDDKTVKRKQAADIAKVVIDWVFRIGFVVLLVVLGVKEFWLT